MSDTSLSPSAGITVRELARSTLTAGLTVRETAKLLRVGTSKILNFIKNGELMAITTSASLAARPRYIILPDALAAFLQQRCAAPPSKMKRRKKRTQLIDYFPD